MAQEEDKLEQLAAVAASLGVRVCVCVRERESAREARSGSANLRTYRTHALKEAVSLPEASEAAPKTGQKKSKNLCTAVWAPSVTPSSSKALSHCLRLWLFSALRKIWRRPEELPTCRIVYIYDSAAKEPAKTSRRVVLNR